MVFVVGGVILQPGKDVVTACREFMQEVEHCNAKEGKRRGNEKKYLEEAIDSVRVQTYPNWEIIFWDNASTDNSAQIAQSYQDERLKYFAGTTTVPLGHARNLAIEKSRGEYIAFLDSDDLWLPEKLAQQVPLFTNDSAVGLVYSDVDYFNQKNEVRRLYALRKPYRGHCFPNLLTDYCLCLSTCMIRKSSLDALDIWFDESLNVCEESDLFLRIGLKSKIDFIPDVLAKYRVHDENWTSRDPELIIRESELILEKLNTLPEVQEHHADAMILAQHQLARQEAKLTWRQGNSAQARRIIRDKIPLTLSSTILFVATFFSHRALDAVYRLFTGVIRSR